MHTDRFSAYSDLGAEDKIGTTADQVAAGDHNHDATYVNEGQSSSITSAMIVDGTVQETDLSFGDPVEDFRVHTLSSLVPACQGEID
ncbi:MAG: hypothetical protein ACE5KJ_04295 [Candidatus Zixiibacteriota bacterium]